MFCMVICYRNVIMEAVNTHQYTFKLTRNGKPVEAPSARLPESIAIDKALRGAPIAKDENGKLLLATSPANAVRAELNNSFIGAIYTAYSKHLSLTIRPDDVWLTIVLAFADYVDHHAEAMRKAFVDHEGKQTIEIKLTSFNGADWAKVAEQFSDELAKRTKDGVRDWIEPRFTTTTSKDLLIGRCALMGALKSYFEYRCCIECGIPEVTLEGTLADWEELRRRVDRIAEYGHITNQPELIWWQQILSPIIGKFIQSRIGRVDNDWWQSCANYISGGSGPSYLSGWVLAFAPFKKGKWRLNNVVEILSTGRYGEVDTTKFNGSATVTVPVTIDDNGYEYPIAFYAGGIVNSYDAAANVMRPSFDFAMFRLPNSRLPPVDALTELGHPRTVNDPKVHKHALTLTAYGDNRPHCYGCWGELAAGYHCGEKECVGYDRKNRNYCVYCVQSLSATGGHPSYD